LNILRNFSSKFPDKIKIIDDNICTGGAKENFSYLLEKLDEVIDSYDYIMFSDQDDIWIDNKIEITLKKMLETEKKHGKNIPILVHTDLKVVDEHLNIIDNSFWNFSKINPELNSLNHLLLSNTVTGCTAMINKNLKTLAIPIDKRAYMHDWWLALIASALGRIEYINFPTILYRQHNANTLGANKKDWKFLRAINNAFKLLNSFDVEGLRSEFEYKRLQANALFEKFNKDINKKNFNILYNFVNFTNYSKLKRTFIYFRYRFFIYPYGANFGRFIRMMAI